jgi:hypothetical protein
MTAMNPKLTGEQADLLLNDAGIETGDVTEDFSQQAVTSLRNLTATPEQIANRAEPGYVVFPNGRKVKISDLNLDHEYLAGDHKSIFADTAKYMKDPLPGAMYVWAKKDDPLAAAKVRSHLYRRVELDELKDDIDLPISQYELVTHKNAGKKAYAQMFDVQLMEVTPEAVKRLYKLPAAQAIMKQAGGAPFERLKDQVKELTRGQASVEYTRKEVLSPIE